MLLILNLNVLLSGEGAFLLNLIHQPKPWKCENHIGAVPSWGPRKLWAKLLLFYLFSSPTPHPMMNKCEFQRNWGWWWGRGVQVGKAQVTHLFISWSDTILREISTFSSAFPKGDPAKQPDRHQPVRCKLGHPGVSLSSTYKWNGKPEQQACFLLVCALLAVKVGSINRVYSQARFSHCMCWRPFPLFRVAPQWGPMPICMLEYLKRHQSPPL